VKTDLTPDPFPEGKGSLLAKVNALRELQSATEKELSLRDAARSALIPFLQDRAFKGGYRISDNYRSLI
jgi:hypothetical protein